MIVYIQSPVQSLNSDGLPQLATNQYKDIETSFNISNLHEKEKKKKTVSVWSCSSTQHVCETDFLILQRRLHFNFYLAAQ